jgi:hypothetical protein
MFHQQNIAFGIEVLDRFINQYDRQKTSQAFPENHQITKKLNKILNKIN